jgi:hypothetical protein
MLQGGQCTILDVGCDGGATRGKRQAACREMGYKLPEIAAVLLVLLTLLAIALRWRRLRAESS